MRIVFQIKCFSCKHTKVLNFIGLHDYSTKKRLFCSKKALGLPRTFSRHIRHAETLNSHSKTAKTPKCIWKSRIFSNFQQENRARKIGKNPMKNWFLIGSCQLSFKLNLASLWLHKISEQSGSYLCWLENNDSCRKFIKLNSNNTIQLFSLIVF